ncbi:YybH family protein [Plebeiibacterium sediminum]|uniref:Nuclear transport factor 2 family protein n=1 Tax=Plebeiibacterium sediminum TaxID=2992112 RepID=A0AAE3M3I6_9BACT|nr:DUF4440 domain-containing protein [Plebeiobacterium sediminum]MCW3786398.1 nuclear transport factor 2 family protein [Plebeiobacterium sediminum]
MRTFNIIKPIFISVILILSFLSCTQKKIDKDQYKQKIFDTEKAFERMANETGIAEAFKFFADENGVILRNNQIIKGKENIFKSIKNNSLYDRATLKWNPDFIDVSDDGDLAYSYGNYTFEFYNKQDEKQIQTGIFHTIWKKQTDGSYKFVWD